MESKQLERIYIHLIQNATKEQIELILDHLKLETRIDNLVTDNAENNNARLMTSMDCLLLFLTNTAGTAHMMSINGPNIVISLHSLSNHEQTSTDYSEQLFDTCHDGVTATERHIRTLSDQGVRDHEQIGRWFGKLNGYNTR